MFDVLKEQTRRHMLPDPTQLHTDWLEGMARLWEDLLAATCEEEAFLASLDFSLAFDSLHPQLVAQWWFRAYRV